MTVKINAGEVFEQRAWPAKEIRAKLDHALRQVEDQRLNAWLLWQADPDSTNERGVKLEKVYRTICREQARIEAAVERWKEANPEEGAEE